MFCFGKAGVERFVVFRTGREGFGLAGVDWLGLACLGQARHVVAGKAGLGQFRMGKAGQARYGAYRLALARQCKAG